MLIGIPRETHPGEQRVPFIPASVERLVKKEIEVSVESNIGETIGVPDEEYKKAGAKIADRLSILSSSDIVLRLRKPPLEEIKSLKEKAIHISFLDPFNEPALIDEMASHAVTGISMEKATSIESGRCARLASRVAEKYAVGSNFCSLCF